MSEREFWEQWRPFMEMLRAALLTIVRWIETKYGLISR